MITEELAQTSMSIIMAAGDARVKCKDALTAVSRFDFPSAKAQLEEAQALITRAHTIQTNAIQGETRGEQAEYSVLFAHAQDTLMTIYSEINLTKQIILVFESYEKRIQALEGN